MKKLYIIATLILSSFLLLSGREVKARVLDINVDFSLINEDFFILKDNVETFLSEDTTMSDYFFISYGTSSNNFYVVIIDIGFNPSSSYFTLTSSGGRFFPNYSFTQYMVSNYSLINPQHWSNSDYFVIYSSSTRLLYSNFSFPITGGHVLNFSFSERAWTCSSSNDDNVLSIYDIYKDYYGITDTTKPADNTPILTDFYTTVIEKIGYLCGVIVSNYIYLSIFVIILIIILFELIFRRRL